jgi:hypothetical protein
MPRQPYLPVYADRPYVVGAFVLKSRDDLAARIGKIMSLWSQVDNEMGSLFSLLLGTQSEAALAVFLTLRRASNQLEALAEAAKYKLEDEELRTFEALSKVYGSLEKQRNALAHGCFGICETDPDLLFCIDLKDHVHFIVETLSSEARGTISRDRHARLKENMYVYRKEDLDNLYQDMESFWWAAFYFNGYLRSPADPGRIAELAKLRKYPLIQNGLADSQSARSR